MTINYGQQYREKDGLPRSFKVCQSFGSVKQLGKSKDLWLGKSQYCTPVGPSIYIPTAKTHINGNMRDFCVVNLEYRVTRILA